MHRFSNTSARSLRCAAAKVSNASTAPILTRNAHKDTKFSHDGRASNLKGVDVLANAVQLTLDPKGRHVIIEQPFGGPEITKGMEQRMATNDKNARASNTTPRGQTNEDQNMTSANAQNETLLKAMQDFIVRVMDPMQTHNGNQTHLGPKAEKLITALQEFNSSIVVRSQSKCQNTVEVSLDEEGEFDGSGKHNKSFSKETPLPNISSSNSRGNLIGSPNLGNLAVLDKPYPTFEEKLLRALREHIFNKMPIRLLCFEPHESSLRITLLERGDLFARIASMVKGKIHEDDFYPRKMPWGKVETEEEAIEKLLSKYMGYAILSHTWIHTLPGEVTYGDWNKSRFNSKDPGYRKLVNFCKAAWKDHGLAFGWMDTVCINKDSSSELDESIRSMYNWYNRAAVCITYLAETQTLPNMHLDPWFTRGWTLQELLAPPVIKFYNSRWKQFDGRVDNDREGSEIRKQIERATTISERELKDIRKAPIFRRMQLAATRKVTREEDMAYSLMGIFHVSISIAYGEGAPRAFFRLLQAILMSSNRVLEILNWAGELPSPRPYKSSVLPPSPQYYASCSSNKRLIFRPPCEPLTLTHMGLRVPVILMPGISIVQRSYPHSSCGDYNAAVNYNHSTGFFANGSAIPTAYNILDYRIIYGRDGWTADRAVYQLTFAVFNFISAPRAVLLPKTCIAIPLKCNTFQGKVWTKGRHTRIQTPEPIVFELGSKSAKQTNDMKYWLIEPGELAKHGMRLVNLYL